MNKFNILYIARKIYLAVALTLALSFPAMSQGGDTLTIERLIAEVTGHHPSVHQAEEGLNSSRAKLGLAKTGYYPNVDLVASYTRLGPVVQLEFPGLGLFKLNPEDNYDAELRLRQSIYDFGKTASKVDYENQNSALALDAIDQVKQRLALTAINSFYSLYYLQESRKIKDEQIATLNQHLDFLEKKKASGSATDYEILVTKVRIANAQSQETDIESARKIQLSMINSLLGMPEGTPHSAGTDLGLAGPQLALDSMISFAGSHRTEMKMAAEKKQLAQLNYDMINTQETPELNLFGAAGFKNGYLPNLNTIKGNFVAGIGFSYPVFDAMRNRNNLAVAGSAIASASDETEITRRTIEGQVVENYENLDAARSKMEQLRLQLDQAVQALALAQTSFRSGAITNLDLLDANTTVSESRLMLLKARIDYVLSAYRLRAAMGERLY